METRSANQFLKSLAIADYHLLQPHLHVVQLEKGLPIYKDGAEIDQAYFPHDGVITLMVSFADGEGVEVGMIGRDGVVGAWAAVGVPLALSDAVVQVSGTAATIDVGHLRAAAKQSRSLHISICRYHSFLLAVTQQHAACFAKHDIKARLCRWLLRLRDLSDSDELLLTQEALAHGLGVRRVSVSLIAEEMQRIGLIRYRRGHIQLLDRAAIQRAACECHQAINDKRAKLFRRNDGES